MKENARKVVVTGGAGYIGSHVVLKLINAGYVPIILDNFQIAHHQLFTEFKGLLGLR